MIIHKVMTFNPKQFVYAIMIAIVAFITLSCSGNNCPLDSVVTCNYYFYDTEGNAITFDETLTVSVLLPGFNNVYVYRKAGYSTVSSYSRVDTLLQQGYKETITYERRDSTLVNKASSKSYLELPMGYFTQGDTLIFKYASITSNDTLWIGHDNLPHMDLPECGARFFHNINSAKSTNAYIDHLEITNPLVDYEGQENIRIYFMGTED